jgi:anti-sigma regulatory factor (Ser/Thr protein kinase)
MSGATSPAWQATRGGCARRGGAEIDTVDRAFTFIPICGPGRSVALAPVPPSRSDQGQAMPGHWPLCSFLELGALPGAVPCARLHARQVAWEWGLAGPGGDAELLVSELLTNAVAAARAMKPVLPVRLWLLSDATQIAILVWDANPQPPVRMQVDDETESGRGLLLVEAVSQRWGWYAPRDTTGKVVWALTERRGAS